MKGILSRLFPTSLSNDFPGVKLAYWVFIPFTALTIWRSQHHYVSTDGGAQSIATIPLDTYSSGASETIVGIFALWGLSQLIIGLIYLAAIVRYRAMIPMLYLLLIAEYAGRAYSLAVKPIETAGTAPGAVANIPFIIFGTVMLVLSLWKTKASEAS